MQETYAESPPLLEHFEFRGKGREYFKIWAVNLLLTVLTLGVYSAWAKTRRLRFFYGNTYLAGTPFQFHGEAKAILLGRIIAIMGFLVLSFSSDVMGKWSLALILPIILLVPYVLHGALRFRLGKSSYRGIRFHFDSTAKATYQALFILLTPYLLLEFLPVKFFEQFKEKTDVVLFVLVLLFIVFAPILQYRWLVYTHGHSFYGDHAFAFHGKPKQIYLLLGKCLLFYLVICFLVFGAAKVINHDNWSTVLRNTSPLGRMVVYFGASLLAYMIYVLISPYIHARMQNLVWNNSSFAASPFVSSMSATDFTLLQIKNFCLTLLSLGLYRPFAQVAVARYRLSKLAWTGHVNHLHNSNPNRSVSVSAEESAEWLGVELGW